MKRNFSLRDITYFIVGVPWLALMLFTSGMYTGVKTAMLGLLIILCYSEIVFTRLRVNKRHFNFIVIFVLYSMFSLFWGILLGYDFDFTRDFSLVQYYIITPIFILILSTVFGSKRERVECIWWSLKYMTLIMAVGNVVKLIFYILGYDPFFLRFIVVNSDEMDVRLMIRVINETSLMFLLPIFIYLTINPAYQNKRDRIIYLIIVLCGIIYGLMSGRKALQLDIVIAFVLSLVYVRGRFGINNLISKYKVRVYLLSIVVIILLSFILNYISESTGLGNIYDMAYETVSTGLSSDARGVTKRSENAAALFDLWLSSPVIGHGVNSYAASSLASETGKWSYEVVYNAWLAQTGIVGAFLLIYAILYIIRNLHRCGVMMQDNRRYGISIGFLCFLVSGATNPMVYFIWPWTISLIFGIKNERLYQ